MKQHRIYRTLFSVTGLMIISKLLGFLKQMVTSASFGTTLETDIIALSQGFIDDLQYLLVQSLLTALITVYIHTRERGEAESRRFAFDVWKAFTLITVLLCAAVSLCAPWIARLLAPAYDAAASAKLGIYLRFLSPMLVLFVWIAVYNALLHANERFLPAEIININQSLWMITLVLLLKNRLGAASIMVSFWVYSLWNAGYTAVLARRYWCIGRGNPFRNPAVRQLLRMMAPLLLGYSLVYINQLVDKILVSGLESGAVTALSYAAVLSNLVSAFITTFASIFFTYVTTCISKGDEAGAAVLTSRTALILLTVFLPVCVMTALCARDIVTVVYGRGAFGAESIQVCAQALVGYAFMFPPLVLREVYSRYLYGYQDSRRPMVNSSIAIVCNVVLSVALCPRFGIVGVTAASSISVAVCGMLNLIVARRTHPALRGSGLLTGLPWLVTGSVACAVTACVCLRLLPAQGALLRFVLTALAGFAAYAAAASPLLLRLLRQLKSHS